jgi:hypothetical protein
LVADSHVIVAAAARLHFMECLQHKPTLCGQTKSLF